MPLIQNGTFTRPLYHGTTSAFLDSIVEKGLGGNDPLTELQAYDTFRELFELGDRSLRNDEFWGRIRNKVHPFAQQEYLGGNLSFRHGESYLTLIRQCAIGYAMQCQLGGCEYLNYMHTLIQALEYKNVDGLHAIVSPQILRVLRTKHTPVLITLNDLPKASVLTETGKCIEAQITEIEDFYSQDIDINLAFKLAVPCQKHDFKIEFLE